MPVDTRASSALRARDGERGGGGGEEDKEMRDGERERQRGRMLRGDRRGLVPDILVFAKCRGIPESCDLDFR